MDKDQTQDSEPNPEQPESTRRFIYRSVEPETQNDRPMRRSTDTPRAFRGIAGQIVPRRMLVKMRIYLKVN
jgi:hypothetical protein